MNRIGKKYSKKRDAILELIQATTSHPSAQWVYEKLKPRIPDLSLSTVYRNINLFRQHGFVISLGVVDGEERFDGVVSPHPHFVCNRCGNIIDITCPNTETLKIILGYEEAGQGVHPQLFTIDYRKTIFYGCCVHCGGE
ncbi:MAG: transcriptional repressor [Treponema sp.]|nr:transcriptional repressor [Treponema sp.]